MRDLNYQLKQLCKYNRDGSFGTQVQRERMLTLIANQLFELGYRDMGAKSLKPKHVEALTKLWIETEVAPGTMKNRMSVMRWWAAKVNKQNVVARSNEHYGLPRREFANSANRAKTLDREKLNKVRDAYVRMSLELQATFGLRREEALKIQPHLADRGDHLWLKPSWTKGGRERVVPIRNEEQRNTLERAKRLVGRRSLIPGQKSYVQQLRLYEGQCTRAGLSNMHGLRHQYAQRRFEEVAGFKPPLAGGPSHRELTHDQRALDKEARVTVSKELGHNRIEITSVYLGR